MTAISSNENETRDTILDGRITLIQPRHGYRFSVEAILLGRFARASTRERVLELGAGCGVVSIMMAALYRPREVVAIEIQPPLAAMIARNAAINGIESVNAVCADLRQKKIAGVEPASFDLVVANPPYRAPPPAARIPTMAAALRAAKALPMPCSWTSSPPRAATRAAAGALHLSSPRAEAPS